MRKFRQVVKASTGQCGVLGSPLVINSVLPAMLQKAGRETEMEPQYPPFPVVNVVYES